MKYVSKRQEVEAMQFDGSAKSAGAIWDWVMLGTSYLADFFSCNGTLFLNVDGADVKTDEYVVRINDYLEVLPKAEFEDRYEPSYSLGGIIGGPYGYGSAVRVVH